MEAGDESEGDVWEGGVVVVRGVQLLMSAWWVWGVEMIDSPW